MNGYMDMRRDMTTSLDEQGIREAITFYVEGMRTGDVETLKRGFHEQAILSFLCRGSRESDHHGV